MEGSPVSEPTEARDEGIVAVVPVPTAQGSAAAAVELLDSSEEYGDSMDIDPAAAASAGTLKAGTSEEQEEEEAWNAQMSVGREILQALDRAFQLHQNADYQVSQVNTSPPLRIAQIRF